VILASLRVARAVLAQTRGHAMMRGRSTR